jgi:hypothetical protein
MEMMMKMVSRRGSGKRILTQSAEHTEGSSLKVEGSKQRQERVVVVVESFGVAGASRSNHAARPKFLAST